MPAPTLVIVPAEPGSVKHDAVAKGFKLDGDQLSPGVSKYYGTDGAGTKGFHDLPATEESEGTDLAISNRSANGLTLESSTGENVSVPLSTPTLAGLQSASDQAWINTARGSLGGDLVGTLPNPTLSLTGVAAGTYSNVTVTVNAQGRITAITNGTSPAKPTKVERINQTGSSVSVPGINASPEWVTVSRNGIEQASSNYSITPGLVSFPEALDEETIIVNFIN